MSVARINMLEFETEDDLNKRAELYEKDAPTLFPNAEILLTIKTGPTTAMSVSIYPDKKSAEKALIRRDKHFKTAENTATRGLVSRRKSSSKAYKIIILNSVKSTLRDLAHKFGQVCDYLL